jgi:uncharacterized protein YciI
MKFAAIIEYSQDKTLVESIRPRHRQYLASLKQGGQLVACGPFLDGSGALIIYETGSADEAEQILKADPFHESAVFLRWQLRPWNAVMANRELLPA